MPRASHLALACFSLATVSPLLFAQDDAQKPTPPERIESVQGKAPSPAEESFADLQERRDRLVVENQLRDEELRRQLAGPSAELQRVKTETDLARAKVDQMLLDKNTEIQKARAEMDEITTNLALESARLQATMQKQLAELRAKRDQADLESQVAVAEFTRKSNEFKAQEVEWNSRLAVLRAKVTEHENEQEAEAYVDQKPIYSTDPVLTNGELIISDRRIPLNGPITGETADFVCSRIDFYNNKDKAYPIFIVIDDSPGGSVMAGYKILKSMQSSTAPVYVVVKSYAASMAAAICTLAQRSYAYPNAIILHHQISNGIHGNLSAQREGVKILEQWWERLATPIAQKMGITIEEFSRQMYAHSSSGDWQEFADTAVKLKWVDVVIGRCRETALIKNPDRDPRGAYATTSTSANAAGAQKASASAKTGVVLPRLNPSDCYYLYNPDGYYRTE